jgi:hypothetical protein
VLELRNQTSPNMWAVRADLSWGVLPRGESRAQLCTTWSSTDNQARDIQLVLTDEFIWDPRKVLFAPVLRRGMRSSKRKFGQKLWNFDKWIEFSR